MAGEPAWARTPEGHRRGAELAGNGESIELLEAESEQRGFRPTRVDRGRKVEFVLGRCPFVDVAGSDPDTVCQLHLGVVEGLAEGLGGLDIEGLMAKDPHRAGCRLTIRRRGALAGARS